MVTRHEHTQPETIPYESGRRPRRRRSLPPPTIVLGYVVAVVMGVAGIMILAGYLFSEGVPEKFRLMFGIVIVLMSVYRFVLTRSRALQRQREEREET